MSPRFLVSLVWTKSSGSGTVNIQNTIDVRSDSASEEEALGKTLTERWPLFPGHRLLTKIVKDIPERETDDPEEAEHHEVR